MACRTFLQVALFGVLCRQVTVAEPLIRNKKTQVTYRGTTLDLVEYFQNVKFAHDTSGERRFSPPEPYFPPTGSEVDATFPGAACPQVSQAMPPFFAETPNMSEDCLNLRIARPSLTRSDAKLPVVVWLHGGGVVKGSAYDPHTDPQKLIEHSIAISKPIIFVALNYRLSIFGFARLPILKEKRSLNNGVRDQRLGFEWVKDNIEAFGGDPDKITAFGLSAGGTFISLHLTSFGGAKGVPFSQAWVMSGPPGTALNMSSDAAELHTLAVTKKLKCSNEDEEIMLQCLKEVPMEKLLGTALDYSVANHPPAGLFTFIPSVDDDMFPDRQSVLYRAGNFVKGIPMVLGWTQDDGAMNAGPAQAFSEEDDIIPAIQNFAHSLSSEDISKLLSLYQVADFETEVHNYEARKDVTDPDVTVHYFQASRIIRDLLFTCSSIDFGFHMNKHSRAIGPDYPGVRLYALNQSMLTPLWKAASMPYVGVSHGSDTNYIFAGLFPEGDISEPDTTLSLEFTTAFINFAYTGSPGKSRDPWDDWPDAYGVPITLPNSDPGIVSVQVVGGQYGSGPVSLVNVDSEYSEYGFDVGVAQEVLTMEPMLPMSSQFQQDEIHRERLLQRCAFINSLTEKLGV